MPINVREHVYDCVPDQDVVIWDQYDEEYSWFRIINKNEELMGCDYYITINNQEGRAHSGRRKKETMSTTMMKTMEVKKKKLVPIFYQERERS